MLLVLRPDVFSKSAQWDTTTKLTELSFFDSDIEKESTWPSYNKKGSAIKAFELSKKPLKIWTESFTRFSFNTVDINVWSAPDKDIVKLVFVTSVSSVKFEIPNIKSLAVYVTLDPDTELVNGKEKDSSVPYNLEK